MRDTFLRSLIDIATRPYLAAGTFAWRFARGKLGGDPAFTALLRDKLLPHHPDGLRLLDLGCGQGLLCAWLHSAQQRHSRGEWPSGWGPAPRLTSYTGVELMPRDIARARAALAEHGSTATLTQGDMCTTPFPVSDAVVILDVLHYVDYAAQDEVLHRVRDCLSPHGTLLLRVGDAEGGWRFRVSNWVDHAVTFVRGHRLSRLYCRPLRAWIAALEKLGFVVTPIPMSQGTPFANVLLKAQRSPG